MWQFIRDFMEWHSKNLGIWVTIPIFTILLPWGIWRRYFYRLPDGSSPPKPNPIIQGILGIVFVILLALVLFAQNRTFE